MRTVATLNLEEEGGVTDISRENAEKLTKAFNPPTKLDFRADKKKGDYFVDAHFNVNGVNYVHTFSGFAWGYSGTGPNGLAEWLEIWGVADVLPQGQIPMDKYGKTDYSWRRDGKFTA